jgi:hypothetical protein
MAAAVASVPAGLAQRRLAAPVEDAAPAWLRPRGGSRAGDFVDEGVCGPLKFAMDLVDGSVCPSSRR